MLDKILQTLNGHGSEVASLEAASLQRARDRNAAVAELEELNRRRHAALLADAPDSELDKLERLIARKKILIEKLDVAEEPLRERLAAAKAAAHRQVVERHVGLLEAKHRKLRGKVLEAEAAQAEFMTERQAAIAECGEHEITTAFPCTGFGGILGLGFAPQWDQEQETLLERTRAAREHKPLLAQPPPAPAVRPGPRPRLPHEPQRASDAQRAVSTAIRPPTAVGTPRPPPPEDRTPLEVGSARVRVLRGGWSPSDDRPQCRYGEVVRVPISVAERAEAAGAVEVIEHFGDPPPAGKSAPAPERAP